MIAENRIDPKGLLQKTSLIFKPKKVVFYTILILTFLLSGLITILHFIPYRMGLVSALIIPLILLYGIKIDRVLIAFIVLAILIGLSALYNHSSILELVIFLRILGFSFLIYYLVEIYIDQNTISKVIRLCVLIAIIQLPIILLQQVFYTQLPARLTLGISHIDFDFGTFNANDAPLAIFSTLIVVFLLFDKKHNYIIRYKWPIALWLTLTVFIVNAEIIKFIIVLVWTIYLVRYLNIKIFVSSLLLFTVILSILFMAGILDQIWGDFTYSFRSNTSVGQLQEEAFLSGAYSRGAAISYYINQGIKWFGDGPSKYFNVFSNIRMRGNTGHIFTFYSEVGLLGWLASVAIFFMIAFPGSGWRIRVSWVGLLSFVAVMMLSFTAQVMNDISIFLIYCIIQKSHLIPSSTDLVT